MGSFTQTSSPDVIKAVTSKDIEGIEFFILEKGEKLELNATNAGEVLKLIASFGKYTLFNNLWNQISKVVDDNGTYIIIINNNTVIIINSLFSNSASNKTG